MAKLRADETDVGAKLMVEMDVGVKLTAEEMEVGDDIPRLGLGLEVRAELVLDKRVTVELGLDERVTVELGLDERAEQGPDMTVELGSDVACSFLSLFTSLALLHETRVLSFCSCMLELLQNFTSSA